MSATSFAQHFYWSLAAGLSVGDAAREARIAVNYSLAGESIDWAVPVVYARDPNARFCAPAPGAAAVLTAAPPGRRRRGGAGRVYVGVWDVQHQYPDLERLTAAWTAAQDAYEFQVVDPSVPLGGWQTYETEDGPVVYLRSDVLGRRLRPTVKQLGVDCLVCLSASPMTDGEILNIFSDGISPALLLSTWGFAVPAADRDRFLTNLVVGQLIAMRTEVADEDWHEDWPRNSPFYYNPGREVKLLINRQRLDAMTQKIILKAMGDRGPIEIAAVEKLFALFQPRTRRRA